MDKLLKEAIADAKAVRETAIANAKLALEEAFTPKLQSMLSAKIREEDEEEMEAPVEEPAMDSEDEMRGSDEMRGASEEMGAEDEMRGSDEMDSEDEMGYVPEMDSADEPEDVVEINGVKYAPIVSEEDEMEAPEMEADMEAPSEEEEAPADDLELEAIIRELEEEMGSEDEMGHEEEEVTEQSDSSGIGNGDNKVVVADGDDEEKAETETSTGNTMGSEDENMDKISEGEETEEEPVDLEEIIKSLSEDQYTAGVDDNEAGDSVEKPESPVAEVKLKEAYATIKFMKDKLQEVNLLNAKLLFTNKLFRSNGLDEGQKLRVIETFDRAGSVREVKLVYSTLAESLKYDAKATKQVKKITEGLASKPSKSTKPAAKSTIINEGNVMADRFKKLAGLIK